MELTVEQKNAVAQWFAQGASLDEIQKRLRTEFDVHMTYLDLRLLVAELPQPVEERPASDDPGEPSPSPSAPQPSSPSAQPPQRYDLDAPDADEGKAVPDVSVSVDALMIPGTMASGDVTFSDGTSGKWYLDQQGRLGLGSFPEGYMPSQPDQLIFRQRLMEALQARGLC